MRCVSEIIKDLSNDGKTIIIIITHDAEFALNACMRAIRIEDGKVTDDFKIDSAKYLLKKMGYKNIDENLQNKIC